MSFVFYLNYLYDYKSREYMVMFSFGDGIRVN